MTTTAATMFDIHPRRSVVDPRLRSDTVDLLDEVARTAQQCADACLHEDATALRHCISTSLDVADLAAAAARVIVRMTEPAIARDALVACRTALRECAEACGAHGGHLRHCAVCAQTCEQAEEQCLRMEPALGHLDSAGTEAGVC